MNASSDIRYIDKELAAKLVPKRGAHAHKWGVGGVLIVGGSPGYIGAPALAASAAGRSGAGIVSLAIPRSSVGPTSTLVPEAVFVLLPESDSSHGLRTAVDSIRAHAGRARAMLVGPGLSRDAYATSLLRALAGGTAAGSRSNVGFGAGASPNGSDDSEPLIGAGIRTVIDADALHWLSTEPEWWTRFPPRSIVVTPHAGEMSALLDRPVEEIVADPAGTASSAARTWNQIVVLKSGTAYASDGSVVRTMATEESALATAGTGDVLAGSISAFMAQGLEPLDAATLSIYLGSAAANRRAKELSPLGVVAGDLPQEIARVLADLYRDSEEQS